LKLAYKGPAAAGWRTEEEPNMINKLTATFSDGTTKTRRNTRDYSHAWQAKIVRRGDTSKTGVVYGFSFSAGKAQQARRRVEYSYPEWAITSFEVVRPVAS
jgi:hypothetical protein